MNKLQGFTLPELLVSVAIAAILLAAALPSMKDVIVKDRSASQINELLASLQLARSEAIKRMAPVTVCASSDGSTCDAAQTWEAGWIVFVEATPADGKRDSAEALLRVGGVLKPGYTLRSNNKIGGYITYLASGRSQTSDTSSTSGQVVLCAEGDTSSLHAVLVSLSGRVYTAKDTNVDQHHRHMVDEFGNELVNCIP